MVRQRLCLFIVGVFGGEDSDEEDEERGGRRNNRRGGGRGGGQSSYTGGQAFVSAGVLNPDKNETKSIDEKEDDEAMDNDIPVTDSSRQGSQIIITLLQPLSYVLLRYCCGARLHNNFRV